jgi:hypothetical protein
VHKNQVLTNTRISAEPTAGDKQHPPDSPFLHPGHGSRTQTQGYFLKSDEELLFSSCKQHSHINDRNLSDGGGGATRAESWRERRRRGMGCDTGSSSLQRIGVGDSFIQLFA